MEKSATFFYSALEKELNGSEEKKVYEMDGNTKIQSICLNPLMKDDEEMGRGEMITSYFLVQDLEGAEEDNGRQATKTNIFKVLSNLRK
jgi:hypothetical protein